MSDIINPIAAALNVMKLHLDGLNARDNKAIAESLHFPHYRLSGGCLTVWDTPNTYFENFLARAGKDWGYTEWGEINPIRSSVDKVHLDVKVCRFRANGKPLVQFWSLWVITRQNGRWAAQLRSSFAPISSETG